ncbi:hypothetical protein ACTJIJ_08775 [Niabella sp. 22666]|uniref:hypothetical protein n=1 Tax=Niabella sp. 22666 TaxID=3453954 RepID=UPI003F85D5B9
MRKFGVLTSTICVSAILAGGYGIVHDQVTYSISKEYFTKFKYQQFGFDPAMFGGDRQTVAVIGFLATWWTGAIIGTCLGLTGLIYNDHQLMKKAIKKAIAITFCATILIGATGFIYARFLLKKDAVDWLLPVDLSGRDDFIVVGYIHNFSYLGGLLGLIIGALFLKWYKKRSRRTIE